jgi:hypothetical protein
MSPAGVPEQHDTPGSWFCIVRDFTKITQMFHESGLEMTLQWIVTSVYFTVGTLYQLSTC